MESPELQSSAAGLPNVLSKASSFILLVASLGGCATQPSAPQVFPEWWNPNLEGHALNQQFRVGDPYCSNAAIGSVPMPQVRVYRPEQSLTRSPRRSARPIPTSTCLLRRSRRL